jgi:hypothetical protein
MSDNNETVRNISHKINDLSGGLAFDELYRCLSQCFNVAVGFVHFQHQQQTHTFELLQSFGIIDTSSSRDRCHRRRRRRRRRRVRVSDCVGVGRVSRRRRIEFRQLRILRCAMPVDATAIARCYVACRLSSSSSKNCLILPCARGLAVTNDAYFRNEPLIVRKKVNDKVILEWSICYCYESFSVVGAAVVEEQHGKRKKSRLFVYRCN